MEQRSGSFSASQKGHLMLEKFGLTEFWPGKISIQCARRNAKTEVTKNEDIPWYFIGKTLAGFSQNGWYALELSNCNENRDKEEGKLPKKKKDFASKLKAGKGGGKNDAAVAKEKAFDLDDVKIAVFLCSDNILKKILAQKLYFSKLSIPFVLPDLTGNNQMVLQLWAYRALRTDNDFARTDSVLVSSIRSTDLPIVRAEILNRLLFDKSHDTFYKPRAKGIEYGKDTDSWGSGCISAGVYKNPPCRCKKDPCTCKRPFDQDMIVFFNLFGNCKNSPSQTTTICRLSSVVILFVDAVKMEGEVFDRVLEIVRSAHYTLLVFAKDDQTTSEEAMENIEKLQPFIDKDKLVEKVNFLLLFDDEDGLLSADEREEEMKSKLKESLKESSRDVIKSYQEEFDKILKDLNNDGKMNVTSDDENPTCKLGKKHAEGIRNMLVQSSLKDVKGTMMPLQVDEWVKWSKIQRDMKSENGKEDDESPEDFVHRMEKEQDVIRNKQIHRLSKGKSQVMQRFCAAITDKSNDQEDMMYTRNYFLHWLKIYLVDICSDRVHTLRAELNKLNKRKKALNKDEESIEAVLTKEQKKKREEINNISLDVRHFKREVGQMVEAYLSSDDKKLRAEAENYSRVMATLFVQGVPLEILDSTARQVPQTFLKSVFEQVKTQMKEKGIDGKVFVLSILGIQSSGKSTLLNALFGTQFETSIGLCTEGVNVQLVPIPEEKQKNDYKYILLVDTKGLLATDKDPAKDPNSGENELATLIFGLSDLTILNMKGAPKTVVANLLQVVTHAMLKIKKVNTGLNISPKCLFVHQNVDAASAEDELRNDNETFMEELDEIVRKVAPNLGLPDKKFSDVINSEMDHNIYIPNLWKGTPPIATISSGYTEEVAKVLNIIYDEIMPKVEGFKADINTFSTRLRSLWEAILCTDFVFSFRNDLEINAYNALEATFNDLRWHLNSAVQKIYNDIKRMKIGEEQQREFIRKEMESELEKQKTSLETFFGTSEGTLLQDLKVRYEKSLENLSKEKEETVMKFLDRDSKVTERKLEVKKRLDKWKEAATKVVKEIAKIELDEGTIRQKPKAEHDQIFQKIWNALLGKVPINVAVDENIPEIVRSVMKKVGKLTSTQMKDIKLEATGGKIMDHTSDHFFIPTDTKISVDEVSEMISHEVTSKICQNAYEELEKIKSNGDDIFDKSYAEQTFQIALRHINEWNDTNRQQQQNETPEPSPSVQLTEDYKAAILAHVGKIALPYYTGMQRAFQRRMDDGVNEFKYEVRCMYNDMIGTLAMEEKAANSLCENIKKAIREFVDSQLKLVLPDKIKTDNYIMKTKKSFERQVMRDVLSIDTLEEYQSFALDGPEYSARCLKLHVEEYLFHNKKVYADVATKEAKKIVGELNRVVQDGNIISEDMSTAVSKLIHKFSTVLPTLDVDTTFREVMGHFTKETKNVEMFSKYFTHAGGRIVDEMKVDYANMTSMSWEVEKTVLDKLKEHLQGCTARCPFCGATCERPTKEHVQDHFVTNHQPVCLSGISGKDGKLSLQTCSELITTSDKICLDDPNVNISRKLRIKNFFKYGSIATGSEIRFSDYKVVYKDWKITPIRSRNINLFWRRFFGKFSDQLAQIYGFDAPAEEAIVKKWANIRRGDVTNEIDKHR